MQSARDYLTPDTLSMLQTIAEQGSFAAAARALKLVPSTLTYRVRQIEEALDVLLYDRNSRQAKLTPAGAELLREGARLLEDIEAVANRVKRVATGWESQLTIALDTIIARSTIMDLCEHFFSLSPPTRLRLRDEALSGTMGCLIAGQADLSIGVGPDVQGQTGIHIKALGSVSFVFAVAPGHPLATAPEPLSSALMQRHRAVAVADSVQRGSGMSFGLFQGQEVFTVGSMHAKLDAQLRGMGSGNLPLPMAAPHIASGRLVAKRTEQAVRQAHIHYAWRGTKAAPPGRALQWWLDQLENEATRKALLAP